MSKFMDDYFGPLSREYCGYFYILSVMFGFLFVFSILSIVYTLIYSYICFPVNGILVTSLTAIVLKHSVDIFTVSKSLSYIANIRILYWMEEEGE